MTEKDLVETGLIKAFSHRHLMETAIELACSIVPDLRPNHKKIMMLHYDKQVLIHAENIVSELKYISNFKMEPMEKKRYGYLKSLSEKVIRETTTIMEKLIND